MSYDNDMPIAHPHIRLRRLRKNSIIRALVEENHLKKEHLIYPLFVSETAKEQEDIKSLPGISRFTLEGALAEMGVCQELGINNIMLFPSIDPTKKNNEGSASYDSQGLMQTLLKRAKKQYPHLVLYADVALDPFTSHGHDGILGPNNNVLNDETVDALCKQSLSYAQAGADFVCPSDMMDGRIGAIRNTLDKAKLTDTGILAYSAKYASSFYGPFREAVNSGARGLDKKTYQLNIANTQEAIRETLLDIEEGADIVMVKPGLPYLDIVARLKDRIHTPIAIYHVSGEYSMLKLAAMNNIVDEKAAVHETFMSMRRAGASMIVSYYAKWAAENIF